MVLDLLILLIIGGFAYSYYRKGFIKALFGLTAGVISLVLAIYASAPLTDWLLTTDLAHNLETTIAQTVHPIVEAQNPMSDVQVAESTNPLEEIIAKAIESSTEEAAKNINDTITNMLTAMLLKTIAVALVFLMINIGIKLAIHFLNIFAKLPVINTVNKLVGASFGAIVGIVIVYVFLSIAFMLGITQDAWWQAEIQNSLFASAFTSMLVNSIG